MRIRCLFGLVTLWSLASPLTAQSAPLRPRDRFLVVIGGVQQPSIVIDAAGNAVFPIIGLVQVAGLSPSEAEGEVLRAMRGRSVREDIMIRSLRRVVVEGEVARTDVLYVEQGTTVPEALVLAGGVTSIGDRRRVEVRRDGRLATTVDIRTDRLTALQSGDEIVVRRLPWYARSGVIVTSIVTTAVSWLVIGTR